MRYISAPAVHHTYVPLPCAILLQYVPPPLPPAVRLPSPPYLKYAPPIPPPHLQHAPPTTTYLQQALDELEIH